MVGRPGVSTSGVATRGEWRVRADYSRVVTALFLPGQDLGEESATRVSATLQRVMAMSDSDVADTLHDLSSRFGDRHDDLAQIFRQNATRVHPHLGSPMSSQRYELLGAVFTHEITLEGSGICNPSVVPHPDQRSLAPGEQRVIMSYRAIGEGHLSTICFRTGVVTSRGDFRLDAPSAHPTTPTIHRGTVSKRLVRALLFDSHLDSETAAWILHHLGDEFTEAELNDAIVRMDHESDLRLHLITTSSTLRTMAANFYQSHFDESTDVSQRVLMPTTPAESRGLEDARFVLTDAQTGRYRATCAAYDGHSVTQKLIETDDFRTFTFSPLAGRGARNKGLALFPRRVRGRHVALSRLDHVSNYVTFSDDGRRWDEVYPIPNPASAWSMLQVGNCGSPLELPEGWLVLTHGIGPMRTYSIGALLLDLDDPTRVVAYVPEPLLTPIPDEQDGYVPNVLYSCGALLWAGTVIIPIGIADQSLGYATITLEVLREHLTPVA